MNILCQSAALSAFFVAGPVLATDYVKVKPFVGAPAAKAEVKVAGSTMTLNEYTQHLQQAHRLQIPMKPVSQPATQR